MIIEPGGKLPEETARAFAAFCKYRDLDPSIRSIERAARTQPDKPARRAVVSQWHTWSSSYGWVARVEKWDEHVDRQNRLAQIKEAREMGERHARTARAIQAKAIERLQTLAATELKPGDVIRMLAEGIRIERTAVGLPSDHLRVDSGPVDHDTQRAVTEQVNSDPEARDLAYQLMRRLSDQRRTDDDES